MQLERRWAGRFSRRCGPSRTRITSADDAGDVEVVTLDSLGVGHVDFVKIDTEGHEDDVLAGATSTLAMRPIVMVEVSPGSHALSTLRVCGYAIYHVREGRLLEAPEGAHGLSNYICLPEPNSPV